MLYQASIKQKTPSLLIPIKTGLQLFADARASHGLVLTASIFYDNALYFKGRSYHEQVPADYVNARSTYQVLIAVNTSGRADDAKYQHEKIFYNSQL